MKRILIFLLLVICAINVNAQEILIPKDLKTIPNSKSYWAYSVERDYTKESIHKYTITANIAQIDSLGNYKGKLKLKDAKIYCRFIENGKTKRINFKPKQKNWVAKFKIHTNQILPLEIVANYNKQEFIMPLKLNKGIYPGESD